MLFNIPEFPQPRPVYLTVCLIISFPGSPFPKKVADYLSAPFIYNILWAIIEPPVFIVTGCLITLGPLYRAKYGPKNLLGLLRRKLSEEKKETPDTSRTSSGYTPLHLNDDRQIIVVSPKKALTNWNSSSDEV